MARGFGTLVLWIFVIWCLRLFRLLSQVPQTVGLEQRTPVSHCLGAGSPRSRVLADWVSAEGSLPGWQMLSSWKESAGVSLSLCKIMNPIPEGSRLTNHSQSPKFQAPSHWGLVSTHGLGQRDTNIESIASAGNHFNILSTGTPPLWQKVKKN